MGSGGKVLLQLANFTLGPDATLNTEIHKKYTFSLTGRSRKEVWCSMRRLVKHVLPYYEIFSLLNRMTYSSSVTMY